jgi:hypothetical protein
MRPLSELAIFLLGVSLGFFTKVTNEPGAVMKVVLPKQMPTYGVAMVLATD